MFLRAGYILIIVTVLITGCVSVPDEAVQPKDENVVLLHGLARTSRSMSRLERHLSNRGFNVINIDYPSRKHPIAELVKYIDNEVKRCCSDADRKLHFVTHSLGGIIIRAYLKGHHLENLGRVVMLSPPNHGTEVVDKLRANSLFKAFAGPAGQQLGTALTSVPNSLGPAEFELGVITGSKSLNPLFSSWIAGADDGTVSTARSKVAGMDDFLVVHHSHFFIMKSREVIEQVIFFLNNGRFDRQINN